MYRHGTFGATVKTRTIKILVTGSNGLVGKTLQSVIKSGLKKQLTPYLEKYNSNLLENFPEYIFDFKSKQELDCSNTEQFSKILSENKYDIIINLAAKVGGLYANKKDNINFYYRNIEISKNVIKLADKFGCLTFSFLSTCVYAPGEQLKEENLHNFPPHSSNYGYSYAKRQHEIMARLSNSIYGDFPRHYCLIPNNLFGAYDNFGEGSHVIPGIISKILNAKDDIVVLPGSGVAKRQFTPARIAALQLMAYVTHIIVNKDNKYPVVNIGNQNEYRIKEIADKIKTIAGKEIIFQEKEYSEDSDGVFQKYALMNKLHNILPGFNCDYDIDNELEQAIEYYKANSLYNEPTKEEK